MFKKLAGPRVMRMQARAEDLRIGFMGRIANIARIHQDGDIDSIGQRHIKYLYPKREILGFTDADRELIRNEVMKHRGA